jgi:hypothetical protein
VEHEQELLLELRAQIDEDIAAADEIDPREGRIVHQVLQREDAQVTDGLLDFIAATGLHEEAFEAVRRDALGDGRRVDARAGLLDSRCAQIRSEDLQAGGAGRRAEILQQRDDERVHLLSRGASGNPEAEGEVGRPILEELGEDRLLERREGRRIPEEAGDMDEQMLVKVLELLRVLLQVADIVVKVPHLVQQHPPLQVPVEEGGLVLAEVHSRGGQE